MSGHIMIVDAVPTNRIVLKVKLGSAYYETSQASTPEDALRSARRHPPSAILIGDIESITAAELVAVLRKDTRTAHLPIMVLLSTQVSLARLDALQAGADDVVSKPIDDVVLLARLRSLQRAREAEAELSLRESTHRALGLAEVSSSFTRPGRIAFVLSHADAENETITSLMRQSAHHSQRVTAKDVMSGMFDGATASPPDVFVLIIENDRSASIALQVLTELRTRANTRHGAIIAVTRDDMRRTAATLLDMGANDLVRMGDLSLPEMLWRLDKLVVCKHKADRLRNATQDGLRAAIIDPLTGLYNRRYAMPHLTRTTERSREKGRGFAVMVADLDHFKAINDAYGHLIGDAVLRDVGRRLRDQLRAVDMLARLGGEEFLIVMPDTNRRAAIATAERLCRLVSDHPFVFEGTDQEIHLTISIGIAMSGGAMLAGVPLPAAEIEATDLLNDADRALYEAKAQGRNTVELFKSAA